MSDEDQQEGNPGRVTLLLANWRAGDEHAGEEVIAAVYQELRAIARRLMRGERKGHTLQPTGVVHEACLRLLGDARLPAVSRAEFLGLAAHVMRRVLVDHARKRDSQKRGGNWTRVSLSDGKTEFSGESRLVDALDLDRGLEKLAALDASQAKVAELRYFGGLSNEEIADVLGVSLSTVKRDWTVARLWLERELGGGREPAPA